MKHQGKRIVTEVRKQVDKRKVFSHSINIAAILYFTFVRLTTLESMVAVTDKCLNSILFSIAEENLLI